MKVVLFCGGQGTRLRDYSESIPKPMVPIGYRPLIWHVMKYYASFGHTDFILCLGYKADYIKKYFLSYNEAISNDFTLSDGGNKLEMQATDIHDWRITFVDTGYSSNIGERLMAVREHVKDEELFLANYADTLTDFPLPTLVEEMRSSDKVAGFLCVKPCQSVHFVDLAESGEVNRITDVRESPLWINGGYFVLRPEIFDYMEKGDELVLAPFSRLIEKQKLLGHVYDGFWMAMETFKDKMVLDEMFQKEEAPWQVWTGQEKD
jgi:glucose-1-phosphate cytidylyltransferase